MAFGHLHEWRQTGSPRISYCSNWFVESVSWLPKVPNKRWRRTTKAAISIVLYFASFSLLNFTGQCLCRGAMYASPTSNLFSPSGFKPFRLNEFGTRGNSRFKINIFLKNCGLGLELLNILELNGVG